MSVKLASYAITAVHYERYGTNREWRRIASVKVCTLTGVTMGPTTVWTRQQVVQEIQLNKRVFTTVVSRNGALAWGDIIEVRRINGIDYIRTDGNNTPDDNLGSLPEY